MLLTEHRASADKLPFDGGHDSIVVLTAVGAQQAIPGLSYSAP
jgi:hypothetical protein